jgi:hypothetical protein
VALPIFFLEGRAFAVSGTYSPRGLVDAQLHEKAVSRLRRISASEGKPKATTLQRQRQQRRCVGGKPLSPGGEAHPDLLPAEGFTPLKSVSATANAFASLLARLRSFDRPSETPSRTKRSIPFLFVDLPNRDIRPHGKEICSAREGWRALEMRIATSWARRQGSSELLRTLLVRSETNSTWTSRLCAGHDAIVVSRGRDCPGSMQRITLLPGGASWKPISSLQAPSLCFTPST